MTETPLSRSRRSRSNSSVTSRPAITAVGSSSTSSFTRCTIARAISTICWSATDSDRHAGARIERNAEPLQQLAGFAPRPRMVDDAEPVAPLMADEDVLRDGQLRKQHELLIDDVDAVPFRLARRRPADRRAVEGHLALIRRVGARNDLDQGGFAGAVLAEQPVNFSRPDLQADAAQRLHAGEAFRNALSLSMPREPARIRRKRRRRRSGPSMP